MNYFYLQGKACSGVSDVFLVKRLADENLFALRILPTEKLDYEKIKVFMYCGSVMSLSEISFVEILLPFNNNKIILKSIRCSHILLHSTGVVKLTGFRHCVFLRHNELTGADNVLHNFDAEISDELLWLAPEILKQVRQDLHGYGLLSDVYSIGITICEMANGFPPFSDMDRLQMLFEKSKGTTPRLLDCTTLPDKEDMERDQQSRQRRRFSESLHVITDNCLKPLPENRFLGSRNKAQCITAISKTTGFAWQFMVRIACINDTSTGRLEEITNRSVCENHSSTLVYIFCIHPTERLGSIKPTAPKEQTHIALDSYITNQTNDLSKENIKKAKHIARVYQEENNDTHFTGK
ncbi:unnamed protein product [Acanthocheilonema viteae]|uniref:Protein kinase domain-containing protein n=1 Tax=Acanthocheilonema viteae TaxID=6277 RepID=A0A498S5V1_ACAVI|nr:unnamed protein product [Acanthocheilonema viteae]